MIRTLLIDNYDSFTFNLYQLLAAVNGIEPTVIKNDQIPSAAIPYEQFDNIVLSPGPGRPSTHEDIGIGLNVIEHSPIPLLGICLGHQAIGHYFGAEIDYAPQVMHGRESRITHLNGQLFDQIPASLRVVRYHSLCLRTPLPDTLKAEAFAEDGVLMALSHRQRPIWGVQFHPESILTEFGQRLIENFKAITLATPRYHSRYQTRYQQPRSATQANQPTAFSDHGFLNAIDAADQVAQPDHANRKTSAALASLLAQFPSIWYLHHRAISWRDADTPLLFETLFENTRPRFWIDREMQRGYSVMGNTDGPYSSLIQSIGSKVRLQTATDEAWYDGSIVELIRAFIADVEVVEVTETPDSKPSTWPFSLNGGLWGYFAYEFSPPACAALEQANKRSASTLVSTAVSIEENSKNNPGIYSSTQATPDVQMVFASRYIVVDHRQQTLYLVALSAVRQQPEAIQWLDETLRKISQLLKTNDSPASTIVKQIAESASVDKALAAGRQQKIEFQLFHNESQYRQLIAACQQAIAEGESYELCLTNQLTANISVDAYQYFKILRRLSPAPESAFFQFDALAIVSASPESFLEIDSQGQIRTKPIKGTRARAIDPNEDAEAVYQLAHNIKERAENLMIVDLLRNDLGRVCKIGSVKVPQLMQVETYAALHQLVSEITGELKDDRDALDCLLAAFPGGSMTGAPKIRSMKILRALEQKPRGIYSGALGHLAFNGALSLSMIIRTAIISDHRIDIGIGGAIVALSESDAEFDETLLKANALLRACARCYFGPNREFDFDIKGHGELSHGASPSTSERWPIV